MKATKQSITIKSAQVTALAIFGLACSQANAALVRIGPGSFTPQASVITFSEPGYPTGTTNPVYTLSTASLGTVTVSFAGFFAGQTVTGGSVNTLATTVPSNPLSLDTSAYPAFITDDGANPTSPVLSGSPRFNGPIAVLFSTPVAAVGLDGGYFDAIGGTSIEAFGPDGASLGIVTNTALGIEFFGLAASGGGNVIQGISFYITGPEPAGFAIDNLTFGSARETTTIVPETGNVAAVALLIGSGLVLRKRRTRA